MKLFFDTSALIKNYVEERGSDKVEELLNQAENVCVSSILEIETPSVFKRLLLEKAVSLNDYEILKHEFETDYRFFTSVDLSGPVIERAKLVIEIHSLKSFDSIHLATALLLADEIDYFIACDEKLIKAASKEGLKVITILS